MYEEARQSFAGGVGSHARSPHMGYKPHPVFIARGEGAKIWDVDGNEYIDYALAFGPLILGHRSGPVVDAVVEQVRERGTIYGAPHAWERQVSEKICAAVPSAELVTFANSGSEAVLVALRLARAYAGRDKIIRFEGHYHGWTDPIYISTFPPDHSGVPHAPWPIRDSAGTPEVYQEVIVPQPWNAPDILEETIKRQGHEIAAVLTEPVMGNFGCIPPEPGYLEFLREITSENDILLIFDEVITGFRLSLGGAQAYFGVTPDLTTMAKALGGGLPVAAVAGRRQILDLIAEREIMQAGTYCTNPVVMAAASATLDELAKPQTYDKLFALGKRLGTGLEEVISAAGFPVTYQGVGPMFQIFFSEEPVRNYREAKSKVNPAPYAAFWRAMLKRGVYFHPWPFECWFVSTAHTDEHVDETLEKAEDAIKDLKAAP
jgi:glutamate-1-semialdehyde 2,1-aminomutase